MELMKFIFVRRKWKGEIHIFLFQSLIDGKKNSKMKQESLQSAVF